MFFTFLLVVASTQAFRSPSSFFKSSHRLSVSGTINTFENQEETPLHVPIKTNPTVIFVVDTSAPGGNQRIDAVKGAVERLMPSTKVAVVRCFYNAAEVALEPTNSFFLANRRLLTMESCVMGNLAAGMVLGLDLAKQVLATEDSALLAIVADGQAHGLMTGSHGCEINEFNVESCDHALYDAAVGLSAECNVQQSQHKHLKTIVIDTAKDIRGTSSESGLRLANACDAQYFLAPQLRLGDLSK
jgi:Mg-chelatase subunit ChlD